MRKTFAVGRLTGSSSHILLVDADGSDPAPLRQPAPTHRTPDPSHRTRLPDPLTVH